MKNQEIIDAFHQLYYSSKVWTQTYWLGLGVGKCPLDLWVFQEIIFETRPSVIIECGTAGGGSALFFASIFDLLGGIGRVVTIDVKGIRKPWKHPNARPSHPRITYLQGDSTSDEIRSQVTNLVLDTDRVMVSLDSSHFKDHVSKEPAIYSELVTPGCYLVIDDTNLGHPVTEPKGEAGRFIGRGPWEAVEEFLKVNRNFVPNRKSREKFLLTFNPRGFLLRTE